MYVGALIFSFRGVALVFIVLVSLCGFNTFLGDSELRFWRRLSKLLCHSS